MAKRVLLFEEDAKGAAAVQVALEKLGCAVTLLSEDAFGGGWVVALAAKEAFDLILIGSDPPAMNGLGVCNRVKEDERTRSVPTVLMSADADALWEHRRLATHADGYLRKPVAAEELALELQKRLPSLAPPPAPVRGHAASVTEEIDLGDAIDVGPAAQKKAVAAVSTEDTSKPPAPAAGKPAARETKEQRKVTRELEKELGELKRKLQAAEREQQAQLARAEKERAAARTDRELAARRAEEQGRRIERGKADLDQVREQLAKVVEDHAAERGATAKEQEQKVARLLAREGEARAVAVAGASRALREELDHAVESRDRQHRSVLESLAREHAEALAARDRASQERLAEEREKLTKDRGREVARAEAGEAELRKSEAVRGALEQDVQRLAEDLAQRTLEHRAVVEKAASNRAVAEAEFEARRAELAEKLERESARVRALDDELGILKKAHGDLERDSHRMALELDAQRRNHEAVLEGVAADTRERVREVERTLGEQRATVEADFAAQRARMTEERDREAARARALEEQLAASQGLRAELEVEQQRLFRELEARRLSHEAALEKLAEERAVADAESAAARLELAEGRDREGLRARALADELSVLRDRYTVVETERDAHARALKEERAEHWAALEKLAAERSATAETVAAEHAATVEQLAAERAALDAEARTRSSELRGELTREAARAEALEADLGTARASCGDLDAERERLVRELEGLRQGHASTLEKLAEERAAAEADFAAQRLEIIGKQYIEEARARALEEEMRDLEAARDRSLRVAEEAIAAERAASAAALASADAELRAQRLELIAQRDHEAARARALEQELRGPDSGRGVPEKDRLARALAAERKEHEAALASAARASDGRLRVADQRIAELAQSVAHAEDALAAEKEVRRKEAAEHGKALASAKAKHVRDVQEAESLRAVMEGEHARARQELTDAHADEVAKLCLAHEQALEQLRSSRERPRRPSRPPQGAAGAQTKTPSSPPPETEEEVTSVSVTVDATVPGRRAPGAPPRLLVIARDPETRTGLSRAFARAGCHTVVRDACHGIGEGVDEFDVIVTEVAGVRIEALLEEFARRPPAGGIVVSTARIEGTRKMFESAGIGNVTVVLKTSRPDALVAAVRAQVDKQLGDQTSGELTLTRDHRQKRGRR